MRTEEDLRTAFDHLADTAPSADEILPAIHPPRPPRRSRTPLILGTVVATVAAALAAPLAVSHLKGADPAPAGPDRNSALVNWVTMRIPATLGDRGRTYRTDYQVQYYIGGTTAASTCLLSTHRNGDFVPATIPAGSPTVMINETKARLVSAPASKPALSLPPEYFSSASIAPGKGAKAELTRYLRVPGETMTTVVWEPAPGLWQLITCSSQVDNGWLDAPHHPDVKLATSIAESVKAQPQPLLTPYRVTHLPTGLHEQRGNTFDADKGTGAGHGFTTWFSDGNPSTGAPKATIAFNGNGRPEPGDDLKISYDGTMKFLERYQQQKPDLTINGRPAWNHSGEAVIQPPAEGGKTAAPGFTMVGDGFLVRITGYPGITQAEILKVAEGLQFAPSSVDKTTWFDAATALAG
ncbi:hypothetical protein GCM10009789_69550 [Kribbella sancticallisti]|uniref:DUF4367 domain-containing protein n=1 Tax=Kribbella sancticallisti TaxID=460087 RepID=A0ABN2EF24_9ACTN